MPPYITKDLISKLSSIDKKLLKEFIDNKFYNNEFMEAISCIIHSITNSDSLKSMDKKFQTRKFINKLKRIGGESADGFALKENFDGIDDFVIVKAPRSKDNADILIHECTVAFLGTNKLRKLCPNFSYIYGTTRCSAPLMSNEEVDSWCTLDTNAVQYAIYENCSPGISFEDMCKTCTTKKFMSNFLQVLFALQIGYRECKFTHYDLHTENVIMRKINSDYQQYIKYGDYFLKTTGYISTIIDYGRSHINVDGKSYGLPDSYDYQGTFRDKSFIMGDVFKLLGFSLYFMWQTNNRETYSELQEIAKYFSDEPDFFLKVKGQNGFYTLPIYDKSKKLDLDEFIDICINFTIELDETILTDELPDDGELFGDNDDDTIDKIFLDLGLLGDKIPTNLNDFTMKYISLSNPNDKKELLKVFDYKTAFKEELDEMEKIKIGEFSIPDLGSDYHLLLRRDKLNETKKFYENTAKLYDSLRELISRIDNYRYVSRLFNWKDKKFDKLLDKLEFEIKFTRKIHEKVKKDMKFLQPWLIPNTVIGNITSFFKGDKRKEMTLEVEIVKKEIDNDWRYDDYSWYWDTYPDLLKFISS